MYRKLVLAIPHATRRIDSEWSDAAKVAQDADRWTDWDTDKLFLVTHPQIQAVIGRISRFDCDLERLQNDPLEVAGQGILYTRSHSGAVRELDEPAKSRLMEHWRAYRRELADVLVDDSLLIDCHSFPSDIAPSIDVCIGVNEDCSKPNSDTIAMVLDYFERLGYRTRINVPFSNALTPETDAVYHSMMIELTKQVYWNERTLKPLDSAITLHNQLKQLYRKLLGREVEDSPAPSSMEP
jgi:N-formylglutamate amidohydrolase